jgi:hypothetical protein
MKNPIILVLFSFCSQFLSAQCETGGAQSSNLGISDCYPFESLCPEEFNARIHLLLKTDDFGQETSWSVTDESNAGIIIGEGNNLASNDTFNITLCAIKDHCYKFTITDSQGNGLDPSKGSYSVYWNGNEIGNGASFGSEEIVEIGGCCTNLSAKLIGGLPCNVYSPSQVSLEVIGGTTPYTYEWSTGQTFTTTQIPDSLIGEISVEVKDAAGCETSSSINLSELSTNVLVSIDQETSLGIGGLNIGAVATLASGIPPFKYLWSTGDPSESIQNLTDGIYSVKVTDATGCIGTAETSVTSVDVKDLQSNNLDFYLYPNPTNRSVSIEVTLELSNEGKIQLIDLQGRVLLTQRISPNNGLNKYKLDLMDFSSGMYLVQLQLKGLMGTKGIQLVK